MKFASDAKTYVTLLNAKTVGIHLTCPFDYRQAQTATVYASGASEACKTHTFENLEVVSTRSVTNAKYKFSECSELLSGSELRMVDAYLWVPRKPTYQLSKSQMEDTVRAFNAIALSGLPITGGNASNIGNCLEEPTGAPEPPSFWLAKIHIAFPAWATERKVPHSTCKDAILSILTSSPGKSH